MAYCLNLNPPIVVWEFGWELVIWGQGGRKHIFHGGEAGGRLGEAMIITSCAMGTEGLTSLGLQRGKCIEYASEFHLNTKAGDFTRNSYPFLVVDFLRVNSSHFMWPWA